MPPLDVEIAINAFINGLFLFLIELLNTVFNQILLALASAPLPV